MCQISKLNFSILISFFFFFITIFIIGKNNVECDPNVTKSSSSSNKTLEYGNELQTPSLKTAQKSELISTTTPTNKIDQTDGNAGGNGKKLSRSFDSLFTRKINQRKNHPLFTNGWRAISIPKSRLKPTFSTNQSTSINLDRNKSILEGQENVTRSTTAPLQSTSIIVLRPSDVSSKSSVTASFSHDNKTHKIDDETYSMKCNVNGKYYSNGEIIPKTDDPCIYCRCFYGKKMCQEQKCPSPPSLDCVPEPKLTNQCCIQYTCKNKNQNQIKMENIITTTTAIPINVVGDNQTPIRRGPQYMGESASILLPTIKYNDNDDSIKMVTNDFESEKQPQHRLSLLFDPIPLIYNSPMQNRIHFPGISSRPKIEHPKLPIIETSTTSDMISPQSVFKDTINDKFDKIQTATINSSPIRTLPQSPVQINHPEKDREEPQTTKPIDSTINQTTTIKPSTQIIHKTIIDLAEIFQISGCNIYGKMYKKDEKIEELSSECKICVCTSSGVNCSQKC